MSDENREDGASDVPAIDSYALLGEAVRRHYLGYYKLVFTDGVLDLRTKELIALGVSLVTGAPNCVEGHLAKCVELGVSRAELEEVVATALGVAGASIVDRADIAYASAKERVESAFAANEGEA